MKSAIARAAGVALGTLRDLWLMLGVLLALVVALETCYRGQALARRSVTSLFGGPNRTAPVADATFMKEYDAEFEASNQLRWEPFLYWRHLPFQGRYVNVDESGRRRTVTSPGTGSDTTSVYFFGGSTMFGTGQRDSLTIPSCVASRNPASASAAHVETINFGESGYVFTQEVLQLMLELRQGARPDVVVFYDGINDVMAAIQNGKPGIPQNEINRVAEFELGRSAFSWRQGIGADFHAWLKLAGVGATRLQLPQRLMSAVGSGGPQSSTPADDLSRELVASYVATAGIVESLARSYGFQTLYIWQPTLPASKKTLTQYETGLANAMKGVPFQEQRIAMHRIIPPMLDSAMKPLVGPRFVNLSELFAGESAPVFLDDIGHTNEQAVPMIVRAVWSQLSTLMGEENTQFTPRSGACNAH